MEASNVKHNDVNETSAYKNVGIASNPTLEDLNEIMPDIANSLREVLEYKGNVEDDLMLTFQVSNWLFFRSTITIEIYVLKQ